VFVAGKLGKRERAARQQARQARAARQSVAVFSSEAGGGAGAVVARPVASWRTTRCRRRRGSRSLLLGGDGEEERRLVPALDPHVLHCISVQRIVGDEEGDACVAVLEEAGRVELWQPSTVGF
jgi:hypothetical protein